MNESTLEYVKINLLNSSHKSATELSSILVAHHQETLVKKEPRLARSNTPANKSDKSKQSVMLNKPLVDLSVSFTLADKPAPKIDTENISLLDLQSAYDSALSAVIDPPEPEIKETKKDKKKGSTPENDVKRKFMIS